MASTVFWGDGVVVSVSALACAGVMARKVRVEFAGACYHVINRGNYRSDLFSERGAARSFERCLFEACTAFGWRLHAFVIMRNHFHLAVETPEPNLSLGMKWLQGTWVARFNRFRGVIGRPFQGRYKALHVEPGSALAQVVHYIHLNPVRAGVVPAERVLDYEWSSLRWFTGKSRPESMEAGTLLRESGALPDTPRGWRGYFDYLAVLAEEEHAMRDKKFSRLSRGWLIGSNEFKAGLKCELAAVANTAERFELLGADRDAHRESRSALWEERLGVLAREFAVDLQRLPKKKSADEKLRLASAMKAITSVSNGWLATRLEMGKTSSVGALIRRFRLQGHIDAPGVKTIMSRFTTCPL